MMRLPTWLTYAKPEHVCPPLLRSRGLLAHRPQHWQYHSTRLVRHWCSGLDHAHVAGQERSCHGRPGAATRTLAQALLRVAQVARPLLEPRLRTDSDHQRA
eukprot:757581-Prymnesium_polylepis.1